MPNQWLCVENRGVAAADLLTIVGASTARGDEGMIGQFGSGGKFSVALLLREGLECRWYLGLDGYTFEVDERETRDVAGRAVTINEVVMRQIAGRSRKRRALGFDMGFGSVDWDDPAMAAREAISNAADACTTQGLGYNEVTILLVDDDQVKARDGYTRVYIQADSRIRDYYDEIADHFLVFDPDFDSSRAVLPKRMPEEKCVRIYRKGVLVGKFGFESIWDYNLNDIELKESRVIAREAAEVGCAKALKSAPPDTIAEFLRAVRDRREVWETERLNQYELMLHEWERRYDDAKPIVANWGRAIAGVFPDNDVLCDNAYQVDPVSMKGLHPVLVEPSMLQVVRSFGGVRAAADVLDAFEIKGKRKTELSDAQLEVCLWVWGELGSLGVTQEKPVPTFEGYDDVMKAGSQVLGYYDPATNRIGISTNVLTEDKTQIFVQTLIEECAHYVTGSADCTRDLQSYMTQVAAKMLMRKAKSRHSHGPAGELAAV